MKMTFLKQIKIYIPNLWGVTFLLDIEIKYKISR